MILVWLLLAPFAYLAAQGWKAGRFGTKYENDDAFWCDEYQVPPCGSDLEANLLYLSTNTGFNPPVAK